MHFSSSRQILTLVKNGILLIAIHVKMHFIFAKNIHIYRENVFLKTKPFKMHSNTKYWLDQGYSTCLHIS